MSEQTVPTGENGLGRGVTLAMAVACGVAVANIYYNQPLLGVVQRDFPGREAVVGFVPTATQLGYAAGILLLVPLGDLISRRTLILAQICALCVALVAVALAPNPWALIGGSVLVGITATLAQQIIPFAAELADPAVRGSVIGTVMSGLLCGILFGRTLAGFVGGAFGWRAVFVLSIAMVAGVGLLMRAVLPRTAPTARMSYGSLLGSLGGLLRDEPALRRSTAIQTALFASFSVIWTVLALRLEQPPFNMGSGVAGLFGVIGGVGVLIAPLAGRVADRRGPQVAIGAGIVLMLLSWLVFGLWGSVAGLAVGVLLLDIGQQSSMVSNQHIIFSLRPEARNRLNTIYVGGMFLGGALGSAGAILCWRSGGWRAVSGLGGGFVLIALLVHFLGRTTEKPRRHG